MALTRDIAPSRRGPPRSGEFGYPPTANETIYRGSLIGLTAAGTVQRLQTAGVVAFAGMADRQVLPPPPGLAASPPPPVVGLLGTWALAVPAASFANIGAPVYATDDGTLTLAAGNGAIQVGTLAGIEGGQTYVKLLGT